MSTVRALVTIPMDSALPEDAVSNTWHFFTTGPPIVGANLTAITTALTAYYQAVDQYLSSVVASPAEVRYYDLADATPRVPIQTDTIVLTPGTNDALPEELALCMSFQGLKVSGIPQARRRGRLFLGPLDGSVCGSGAAGDRPTATVRTGIAAAGAAMLAASDAALDWSWVIWSEVSGAAVTVTDGWVDNAFDVQRRRGVRPTARTLFT